MRNLSAISVFVLAACTFNAGAQSTNKALTSKSLVKEKISSFLVDGEVVKSQKDVDAMPTNKGWQRLEKTNEQKTRDFFIDKFKMPAALTDFTVLPKFSYNQMPLSVLGSMVFPAETVGDDVDKIMDRKLPMLLVSSDLSQVSLEDPADNKYELNINLLTFMNWALSASAETDVAGMASAKAEAAIKRTFSDKKSISIVYGYFQNSLATLFNEVKRTKRLTDKKDFAPLFDLWLLYSSDYDSFKNKFIISGFNALLIEDNRDAMFLGDNSASAMADFRLNIPYLKLNADADFTWKSEKAVRNSVRTVSLFLKGEPNFISLPTPEEITETWEYMTSDLRTVVYPDGKFLTVSDYMGEEPVVKVLFGPLSGTVVTSDLSVREVKVASKGTKSNSTYIKSFSISGAPIPSEDVNSGLYYLPIKLELDRPAIASAPKLIGPLTVSTTFEVYYKKSCIVNKAAKNLSISYPLLMHLNTGPAPRIISANSTKDGTKQKWSIEVLTTEEVEKLTLDKIEFKIASLAPLEQVLVNKATPVRDATNPRKWTLQVDADLLDRTPSYGERIPATFTFSIAKKEADIPNIRAASTPDFQLRYSEAVKLGEEIVSNTIENLNLVENLSDTITVSGGQQANALLAQPNLADTTKQKVINQLFIKKVIRNHMGSFYMIKGKL